MDWEKYDWDAHWHPDVDCGVEVVIYPLRDRVSGGEAGVFIAEPPGNCPKYEAARIDGEHIFVTDVDTVDQAEAAVLEIKTRLGSDYDVLPFYREMGGRKTIGKIYDALRAKGRTRVTVRKVGEDEWEISMRRRDFEIARQVVSSNTGSSRTGKP